MSGLGRRETGQPGREASLGFPVLLLALVMWLAWLHVQPPPVAAIEEEAYSTDRTRSILATLLADQAPHPTGSPAQEAFRARLVDQLAEAGLEPAIQDTTVCSQRRPYCGRVRNVLARIEGEGPEALLLMAHYDTVAVTPGAGDNGAAVAVLTEIARLLREGPRPRNSVVVLFTDAEERGHFGAEAFFSQHPWAADVQAVINMDGAGSSGGVYILRLGPDSGHLLRAFRDSAAFPIARSIRQALFERIGSGSDFAVAIRHGLPGIDFSFTGQRLHNHSPLDTLERLDSRTLQHHAENVLPLARVLAGLDLSERAPNPVYYVIAQRWWLWWSPGAGIGLAIVALLLLAATAWRVRAVAGPVAVAAGGISGLVVVVSSVVAVAVALQFADLVTARTVAWPATAWPWRVLFLVIPWLVLLGVALVVRRWIGGWALLLGVWTVWVVLALALTLWAPLAASLMLPPVVAMAALVALFGWRGGGRPSDQRARWLALAGFALAAYFIATLLIENEIVAGLRRSDVLALGYGLLIALLLPVPALSLRVGYNGLLAMAGGVVLIVALCALPFATVTSAKTPRWINVSYVEGVDLAGDASPARVIIQAPPPIPSWVAEYAAPESRAGALPWQPGRASPWGETARAGAPAPMLDIDVDQAAGDSRTVSLTLRSTRGAEVLELWLDEPARVESVTIDGQAVPATTGGRWLRIGFFAPPADGIGVTLRIDGAAPLRGYLVDNLSGLPPLLSPLAERRAPEAQPYDNGDQWQVYREVRL